MATFKASVNKSDNQIAVFNRTVADLLECLTQVRMFHWSSRNNAEHKALGDFYDKLSDFLDGLVEPYQGAYGLVNLKQSVESESENNRSALEYLQYMVNELQQYRAMSGFPQESWVQNGVDEIVREFYRTIYKLRFLK